MHTRLTFLVFALIAAAGVVALIDGASRAAAGSAVRLDVDGTAFRVERTDGRIVEGRGLEGATLSLSVDGRVVKTRIVSVYEDPEHPGAGIWLHDVRVVGDDGAERPLCREGPDGIAAGFPLAGRFDSRGSLVKGSDGEFEFVCTAGARGKCVRFGYPPFGGQRGGHAMLDAFNACVRMVRADWCGDGRGHTVNGTLIGYSDDLGINRPEDAVAEEGWSALRFEAAWDADGAVCVAKPRIDRLGTLDTISRECPRLRDHLGTAACAPGTDGLLESWSR